MGDGGWGMGDGGWEMGEVLSFEGWVVVEMFEDAVKWVKS
jgi:hypothetical protein